MINIYIHVHTVYIYIYPPFKGGWGGKNWNISKRGGSPPTPRNISAKKMVSPYIYIYILLFIHIYRYVYLSTCMYIYICICTRMYVYVCSKWKGVPYHLWATMWHPEDPLPRLLEAQKTRGGGIFHVVRWNISQKFLALPPPNIPGLKWGIYIYIYNHRSTATYNIHIYIHIYIYILILGVV